MNGTIESDGPTPAQRAAAIDRRARLLKQEWLSKADAVWLTGLKYRAFEKRVEQGLVRKRILQELDERNNRPRPVFSRADIEALLSGFPNKYMPLRKPRPRAAKLLNSAHAVSTRVPETDGLPALIRTIVAEVQRQSAVREIPVEGQTGQNNTTPAAAFPPWLDIYQAALFSNLPPAFLRRHAKSGLMHVLDIGAAPGGRLRFNRDSLATLGVKR